MGKNVAVFVDVANIFYAAKAAGVDIDYVLLLKAATAGRDLVRAYAYTGLDPDNENQRNFHSFLARHDFRVVSKDIRKYGDGKVKANLDIELVVDMMKTARNLDVAVVVSGDGDFAPAIRAVQEMGVRCEVISFRGNTSSDLMDVADKFTDITQLAKVEKGSTVSGRRVPSDDEDLSMTEVPDKLSEGTGHGRGRGRGRVRVEREPVAASRPVLERAVRAPRTPRVEAIVGDEPGPVEELQGQVAIVALPGEKLSKARTVRAPVVPTPVAVVETDGEPAVISEGVPAGPEAEGDEDAPRRRRRRGGRGRGRGRGHEGGVETGEDGEVDALPAAARVADDAEMEFEVDDESIPTARPAQRPAAFGSVWDSQIGVAAPVAGRPAAEDEEFDDEPEIPEYLLAERRNRGGQGARGGQPMQGSRGGRGRAGSYAAAIDRERYGRGGAPSSAGGSVRFGEPAGRGGPNRDAAPRRDLPPRRDAAPRRDMGRPVQMRPERLEGQSGSSEPWSEVPPELEELLKAQLAQKLSRQAEARPAGSVASPVEPVVVDAAAAPGRGRRRAVSAGAAAAPAVAAPSIAERTPVAEQASASTPTPSTPRRRRGSSTAAAATAQAAPSPVKPASEAAAAPKRRAVRSRAAAAVDAAPVAPSPVAPAPVDAAPAAAPKRRSPRASAAPAFAAASAADNGSSAEAPAPKRKYVRKAAAPAEGA